MRPPRLCATIERRLLINYRADPAVIESLLPAMFRPQLVNGYAVAGICLIRLGRLRPYGVPAAFGSRSEGAAHRIAVEWDTAAGTACGVYVPRRDSASLLHVLAGGRLYPGSHHRAKFAVNESSTSLRVSYATSDDSVTVDVTAEPTADLTGSELFRDLGEASAFFQAGDCAYSPDRGASHLDGLKLQSGAWSIEATRVVGAVSSFYDDQRRFPPGSITLDSALLMRDVPVSWVPQPRICLTEAPSSPGESAAQVVRASVAAVASSRTGTSASPSSRNRPHDT